MKSQVKPAELLKSQISWVERQSGCVVEKIVLDGKRKCVKGSKDLEACGIEIYSTAPYTPQEKGIAKQMNCTIKMVFGGCCFKLGHWQDSGWSAFTIIAMQAS